MMKNKGMKGILNLSVSLLYKTIVILIGLLLPKLFITNYGSELNGLQASVKQIFTYIALLESGIGASTLQMLYRPVAEEDYKKSNEYLSAAANYYNRIGIAYFVALLIIGVIYSIAIPVSGFERAQVWLYIVVSGALTGINFFYVAKLKLVISAEGDIYLVSLITMITYIFSSITKIIMISLGINIILVEIIFLVINIGTTFLYFYIAKRKYPWISFKEKPDFTCTEQKNSVLVHRITSVIFQNVDVLLLTILCSLEMVSIYSMYKMIVNMVTSVIGTVGDSVNFIFGQSYNTEMDPQKPKYKKLIDVYNVYYSSIAMGLYTVVYILILPFLEIYTEGMDINYIYPAVPLLYIGMEFLSVGREAMVRTIDVAGHYKKTQWRAVMEAILNIGTSVLFILIFVSCFGEVGGLYGVLLGTIVALFYRTLDIIFYAEKNILHRKPWKSLRIMIENILIFVIVNKVFRVFDILINDYVDFVFNGIWISIVVLLIYCVLQSLLHLDEAKCVMDFIKRQNERN